MDPLDQVYRDNYGRDRDYYYDSHLPDYRDKHGKAVPITQIFPQVSCLILPGDTENKNFVGDLSQVKHLTLFNSFDNESPTFPNLDLLEVREFSRHFEGLVPMPSKIVIAPDARIELRTLPKTMEVIETILDCDEYISVGKPHFSNLKVLKNSCPGSSSLKLETLINFWKDHKASLTELSFSAEWEDVKVLLPLLTHLKKLSIEIKTAKQAKELKEIKTFAQNLEYFELCCVLPLSTDKTFGRILDNLPIGLDNLSIKDALRYGEINIFLEKIMEKVVNGETKRVTFANGDNWNCTKNIIENVIEKMVEMKPEPVKIEVTNTTVLEGLRNEYGSRTEAFRYISDIVISL